MFKRLDMPITTNEDGSVIYYKGKVRNRLKIATKKYQKGFYYFVNLDEKHIYVQQIVARAFVPNVAPKKFSVVIHKNGDTLDNHYLNLMWGSRKTAHGYHWERKFIQERRKFSAMVEKEIYERATNGETLMSLAKEFGCSHMTICRIKKRFAQ